MKAEQPNPERDISTREFVVGLMIVIAVVVGVAVIVLWLTVPGLLGPHGTQPAPGYPQ